MSIVSAGFLIGVGIFIATSAITLELQANTKKCKLMKERMEKRTEKRRYIHKFIYENPELSFYEAMELKSKLGNIYEEWNDE